MSNWCDYELKVCGKKPDVEDFAERFREEFDLTVTDGIQIEDNVELKGFGMCAWSVLTSIIRPEGFDLKRVSKELSLAVEIYSTENGMGFQEHYLVIKGEVLKDDCEDYVCYLIDEYSDEEIDDICWQRNITRDELSTIVNEDGYLYEGGIEGYGEFEDLFTLLHEAEV